MFSIMRFCTLTRLSFSQKVSAIGIKTPPDPSEGSEKGGELTTSTQRKRLMISLSEKEKLLNWDELVTPEETPSNTKNIHQHKEQVEIIICQDRNSSLLERNKPAHEIFFLLFISRHSCLLRYNAVVQRL